MSKKIEWYHDFINLNYKPRKTDLKVLYYFEPAKGITRDDAIGRIASESSTGTWTTLFKLPPRMKKIMATAYKVQGNFVHIAYPLELWEKRGTKPREKQARSRTRSSISLQRRKKWSAEQKPSINMDSSTQ